LRGKRLPWWGAAACVAAGAAAAAFRGGLHFGRFDRLVLDGIPGLLICTGFVLAPEPGQPGRIARLLRLGGDASYALYLSHTFTITMVEIVYLHSGLRQEWAGFALGILAAIAVAILFYRIVERPLTDALQRATGTKPLRGAAAVAP
jgi:peptidoglycan/LPS O-acetylase OafA/YrhL